MDKTWVVVGSGPSLTQDDVNYVRGKAHVIVCNTAWRLAPWADVLVGCDPAWWDAHPEAQAFAGEKFSPKQVKYNHVSWWIPPGFRLGQNTGLYGMHFAKCRGAERIVLLGFDMHAKGGTHFFGDHPAGLSNPNRYIFENHLQQFEAWTSDAEVINCTPQSALKRFVSKELKNTL